ncbi:phage baseplate assembly protein [Nitrobacter sp.]|uniref:phage baseplate assembly protein n=1 Tax=Nitrobacter sp. TaxID=29420 RepID=UPI003F651C2B
MAQETISIAIGGERYTAFERVTVTAAMNKAARTFSLTVAAEIGASATNALFAAGVELEIYANADLLLSGFVDGKQPKLAAEDATIEVSGRSSSGDLIDSSADHRTGRFENKTPLEIGNELSSDFDKTGFVSDQQLDRIEQYQLTPGESVFRCVEKMCRQQGMTLTGTADGRINITKAGALRQGGGLIEGQNILEGTSHHNAANRHSTYKVRGQRPFDHGEENLEIEETADDDAVKRHRPLIVVEDEDTTKDRARKRAKNRRDRAAGNALKATIRVQGFHDETGQLWTPGNMVWTESPFLDIAQDMLIEQVEYEQSGEGSIATLSLTDPRAYGGTGAGGGKGNRSGGEWEIGD